MQLKHKVQLSAPTCNHYENCRPQEALEELRHKQRAVYDVRVVALRRAVLRALCSLCSRADLVAAELAPTAAAKGGKGKGQKSGGSGQPEGFLAGEL